jgi:hypothetical protein
VSRPSRTTRGQQHLLQARRQRARAGAAAGEHQLLGEERVAFAAGVDVVDQARGLLGAEQAGELLNQLGAGEPGQLQPLHAAVAGKLGEQPAQRVQAVQLVAAEGEHQQDPTGPKVGGEEGDQVAGGAVGPVQVLHDPQQRRPRASRSTTPSTRSRSSSSATRMQVGRDAARPPSANCSMR